MERISGLIYVGLLFSVSLFGQGGINSGAKKPGKLDSISRPEEVEALVRSIEKRFARFQVNTALAFEEKNCFSLAYLSKVKPITKADFDKNGYTDLLVIGEQEKTPTILTLMGSGDNKVSIRLITAGRSRRCSLAKVITEGDDTFIEYRYFKAYSALMDSAKLIFRFGDFVEYNPNPKVYNIEKIEYKFDDAFTLEINSDRKATQKAKEDYLLRGLTNTKYIGRINTGEYDELLNLLNYSDFPNLHQRYIISGAHYSSGILKITHSGGQLKIIADHGLVGTFSLRRIHERLAALRTNQGWKNEISHTLVPLPHIQN